MINNYLIEGPQPKRKQPAMSRGARPVACPFRLHRSCATCDAELGPRGVAAAVAHSRSQRVVPAARRPYRRGMSGANKDIDPTTELLEEDEEQALPEQEAASE